MLAALVAILLSRLGVRLLAIVVLSAGTVLGGAAMLSPFHVHPALQRVLRAFGRGVGRVVTWLLLVPLFYLVFTPFGLLARRGRRDPMARRLDRTVASYWEERPAESPGPEPYERQF